MAPKANSIFIALAVCLVLCATAAAASYRISGFTLWHDAQRVVCKLQVDRYFAGSYNAFFVEANEPGIRTRLVVDFNGARLSEQATRERELNRFIARVKVGQFEERVVRVVFYAKVAEKRMDYEVVKEDNAVVIRVSKVRTAKEAAPGSAAKETAAPQVSAEPEQETEPAERAQRTEPPPPAASPQAAETQAESESAAEAPLAKMRVQKKLFIGSKTLHTILFAIAVCIVLYAGCAYCFSFSLSNKSLIDHWLKRLDSDREGYFKAARIEFAYFAIKIILLFLTILYIFYVVENFEFIFG